MTDGNPLAYECPVCEKRWATPSAADDCCGEWLEFD